MTQDNLIEQFLTYQRLELNRSPLTVDSYRSDICQFAVFLVGDSPHRGQRGVDWASVTAGDIRTWLVERSAHGDCARTIRRKVQALRAFYRWQRQRDLSPGNPAAEVELARLPRKLPQVLRPQRLDELLDSAIDETDFEQVRDRTMLLMLYSTGLRRAELIGLRDAAVDTHARQLRVRGKRDKDRIVPFGDEMARWIDHYRRLRQAVAPDAEAFFVRANGLPLYPTLVYRVVRGQLQRVGGARQLSPHVLRHSFASAMLNDGADINSVKELLGHESLAATQVYTHITLNQLKTHYQSAHPRALKNEN